MKLIDVRVTPYGKVADVRLDSAALSFSMPYVEYALLEKCGMLDNEDMAIESNIRFMTMIHEFKIPYQSVRDWQAQAEADHKDWLDEKNEQEWLIGNNCIFGSSEWFDGIEPIEF